MITYDYYAYFYFRHVVRLYKSSKNACNNQPNITRCMNILEQELKCTLFLRSNRGISLTPEKKLYEHVAIAYEQLQIGEEEIRQNGELENGLVSIGASENALRLVLLSRLEKFHEQYPHVRLRISNHSTPQAIQALRSDIVDFAAVTLYHLTSKSAGKYLLPLEILIRGENTKSLQNIPRSLKILLLFHLLVLMKILDTNYSPVFFWNRTFLCTGYGDRDNRSDASFDHS